MLLVKVLEKLAISWQPGIRSLGRQFIVHLIIKLHKKWLANKTF